MRLPIANALAKLANLPEPPPDSGEPPPPETQGISTPEKPWVRAAKAVGGGALAFGAGTAAGSVAGLGAKRLFGGTPAGASRLMRAAPAAGAIAGGLMGLAYNQYKHRETEELHHAFKSHQEQRARSRTAQ